METERRRTMKETEKKVMITPFGDNKIASAGMEVWGSGDGGFGEPCNDRNVDHGTHLCWIVAAPTSITKIKNTPVFSSIG